MIPQYGTVSVYASRITDTPGPDDYTQKVGPAGKSLTIINAVDNLDNNSVLWFPNS